jgi:Uncharacterised nucleotidyltransferase
MSFIGNILTGRTDWAWPKGNLDLLITAALHTDDETARAAFQRWDTANDLDAVSFREHRLLAAIAHRHGKTLADLAVYPRLSGLQRQLWTRARLASRDCAALLGVLDRAGVRVMLIKGAARIARDPAAQQGRVFHDIDILLRPEDFDTALSAIFAAGWTSGSGESQQSLRTNATKIRSRNVRRPPFGDADLHLTAFHDLSGRQIPLDRALWARAANGDFFGQQVLLPCLEDQLAIALAHGARDSFGHADWLVDASALIDTGRLDWDLFEDIARSRAITNEIAIAFSYLAEKQLVPTGAKIKALTGSRLRRAVSLIAAKPKTDLSRLGLAARYLARQALKRAGAPLRPAELRSRGRLDAVAVPVPAAPLVHHQTLGEDLAPGRYRLTLALDAPSVARRIDFEVNGVTRHYGWLTVHSRKNRFGPAQAAFDITLPDDREPGPVLLISRPRNGRPMDLDDPAAAGIAAVPFAVLGLKRTG